MATKQYDSTIARIAGNLLSGMKLPDFGNYGDGLRGDAAREDYAKRAVAMARAIVAEVERTESDLAKESP